MNTDGNAPHKRVSRQIREQSRHQWQPIETAPWDSPILLLHLAKDGQHFYGKGHLDAHDAILYHDCAAEPTHWMPLPTPPKP